MIAENFVRKKRASRPANDDFGGDAELVVSCKGARGCGQTLIGQFPAPGSAP